MTLQMCEPTETIELDVENRGNLLIALAQGAMRHLARMTRRQPT
ncbi:hypothetical protein [Bradyrhizobium sp. USDA 4486]